MTTQAPSHQTLYCSFCVKSKAQVANLISGPGVYICDECVRTCVDILSELAPSTTPELHTLEDRPDDQILELLPTIGAVSAQVNASLQTLVTRLRAHGVPWIRIGAALGITRQSAWERFTPPAK